MSNLLRDLGFGLRSLRRSPAFTIVALLTIALGIGATTAIFSVVHAVLLRPLPYSDAERLVLIWGDLRNRDVVDFPTAPADFHDMREQGTLFEELGGVTTFRLDLNDGGAAPEQIRGAAVTTNLLAMLGARVMAGRDFQPDDGTPVPPPPEGVAPETLPPPPPTMTILSHEFWLRRYGGDASVIGRTVEIGGQPAEVIGVLAPGVQLLFPPNTNIERVPDAWMALRVDWAAGSRINVFLRVIGRLRPGVTLAAAQAQLDGIAADLRRQFPIKETAGTHFRVERMHDDLVAEVRPAIVALMGAVLFVLLIACANVANLLLVRSAARERELSIRAALGGSRSRLLGQLLAENFLLAGGGALLGVGLAAGGIRLLMALQPDAMPRIDSIAIDPLVLAFTALLALGAALVFGLVPAWRAAASGISGTLRDAGRSAGLARGGILRSGVVIAEVALAFVLLIGSGLMLRTFATLQNVDPGFDDAHALTFVAAARGNDGQQQAFIQGMRDRLGAIPGVTGVTAASPLPLDGGLANARWGTEAAAADPALFQQANVHFVLPGYFEVMRTRLIEGRTFEEADNDPARLGVVIDEVLARKAFGGEPAVGRRLLMRLRTNEPETVEVLGVVAHQRHVGLAGEPREAVFVMDGFANFGAVNRWVVRTDRASPALAAAIRPLVAEIDPQVAVAEIQPMSVFRERAMAPTRFALTLIGIFALVAAFLAAIGLYGVLSTTVRDRTPEIGVRLAFGASGASILRMVVGQGLRLTALGVVAGVAGAVVVTRVLGSMLVGVRPTDPATYILAAFVFLAVAAAACAQPAIRASRLDPNAALRS